MIIETLSHPRAALIGNPSDGYNGKTIAFTFSNFRARIVLYESPELTIQPSERDRSVFESMEELVADVAQFGYYGGIRLLKAAIRVFYEYCRSHGIKLSNKKFTIRYHSDVPHLVGLAGSSAIITACMRALCAFYGVTIPKPVCANYILSVETKELNISAGLQDRVAQVYRGLTYMDFHAQTMHNRGYGTYRSLDATLLPPLYIAYRTDLSEGSEKVHNRLRERYEQGDATVTDAIGQWIELTERFVTALEGKKREVIDRLINENFDIRRRICPLSDANIEMVECARAVGASAKFTGSGGAIIGSYRDEAMFRALCDALQPLGAAVIKPHIVDGYEGESMQ